MKVSVVLAGLVWPVLAFGQQAYTNADLAKFDVPGAYTNEDLRKLPPLTVQKQAAEPRLPLVAPGPPMEAIAYYNGLYESLRQNREALAFERDYEIMRVDFSESPYAGDSQSFEPRLGYRTRVLPLVMELEKRIAILEHQMELVADDARHAGVLIDLR
jgi:hypothetical protein